VSATVNCKDQSAAGKWPCVVQAADTVDGTAYYRDVRVYAPSTNFKAIYNKLPGVSLYDVTLCTADLCNAPTRAADVCALADAAGVGCASGTPVPPAGTAGLDCYVGTSNTNRFSNGVNLTSTVRFDLCVQVTVNCKGTVPSFSGPTSMALDPASPCYQGMISTTGGSPITRYHFGVEAAGTSDDQQLYYAPVTNVSDYRIEYANLETPVLLQLMSALMPAAARLALMRGTDVVVCSSTGCNKPNSFPQCDPGVTTFTVSIDNVPLIDGNPQVVVSIGDAIQSAVTAFCDVCASAVVSVDDALMNLNHYSATSTSRRRLNGSHAVDGDAAAAVATRGRALGITQTWTDGGDGLTPRGFVLVVDTTTPRTSFGTGNNIVVTFNVYGAGTARAGSFPNFKTAFLPAVGAALRALSVVGMANFNNSLVALPSCSYTMKGAVIAIESTPCAKCAAWTLPRHDAQPAAPKYNCWTGFVSSVPSAAGSIVALRISTAGGWPRACTSYSVKCSDPSPSSLCEGQDKMATLRVYGPADSLVR
jgi:hypothetical protein